MIEARPIQIRRNLYDALRSIRLPSKDLDIWVDAIRINQSNITERYHQAAKMGETFTNAKRVIA